MTQSKTIVVHSQVGGWSDANNPTSPAADKAITWCSSSWRESGAYDWLLNDRQVDDCREHAEQNREPPNDIIRPGALEEESAEPHPKKSADLMAEERKAE